MQFDEGNKAINLRRLKESGFNVPAFVIVPPGLQEQELIELVNKELLSTEAFAVRSSSPCEDTQQESKAGKFYSAIAVKRKDLFTEYIRVLDSYGEKKSGVIIQQFVPSVKAGILFTDNGSGKTIINSNFGLCKYVVEGKGCDEYVVDSAGKIIRKYTPAEKEFLYSKNYSLKISKTRKSSLTDAEIKKLFLIGKEIQKLFVGPQDIEWCFFRKQFIILQTRFITRPIPDTRDLIHYDSANIAESYSGIVLPLTLSFAQHIYGVVYKNLLHASGVRRKKLQMHQEIFENMVSWFYGRLYYNMNNWYRMMAFIPGYRRNKTNLENMITSNIRLNIERNILPGRTFRVLYPLIVFFKLVWYGRTQTSFEKKIRKYLERYRRQKFFEDLTFEECLTVFKEFDKELISRWHIPVENDFMVMTFFGLLQNVVANEKLQEAVSFNSKTGQQIDALIHIKDLVYDDILLQQAIEENITENFRKALLKNEQILHTLEEYYSEYGGRFANELKLESPDVEEDAGKLISLLRLYRNKRSKPETSHIPVRADTLYVRILIRRFRKYAAQRESMRLLRSNGFSVVRKLFIRIGALYSEEKRIEVSEDIFYLSFQEIFKNLTDYSEMIAHRKEQYKKYYTITPPVYFTLAEGESPPTVDSRTETSYLLKGRTCSAGFVKGKVRVFKEFELPDETDFDIVVARNTDPGWTPLLGVARGLIIENGGILSHAAIVSRELGIPTVIGVENATNILRTGMIVGLDATTGLVRINHAD
jgi:pyruvate,water dikinase